MSFFNWMADSLASETIIDLYFVFSDLKEQLPFTFAEEFAHAIGNATGTYQFRAKHNRKKYDLTDHDSVKELAADMGISVGRMVL